LRNLISQLSDDLALQRTILASLQELPQDAEVEEQVNDAKTEIKAIQSRLTEARRAQHHGMFQVTLPPPPHRWMTILLTLFDLFPIKSPESHQT